MPVRTQAHGATTQKIRWETCAHAGLAALHARGDISDSWRARAQGLKRPEPGVRPASCDRQMAGSTGRWQIFWHAHVAQVLKPATLPDARASSLSCPLRRFGPAKKNSFAAYICPNSGFFFLFSGVREGVAEIVTGNFFRSQITTDKIILLLYVRCLYWQDD